MAFTSDEILDLLIDDRKIDAFMGKLNIIAGTSPRTHDEPVIVILGGSPGVGKTTFIENVLVAKGQFGITEKDYFVVSFDNIIENFAPFQENIRNALVEKTGVALPKNYKNANALETNYAKIEPELGSLAGQYVKYFNPYNKHKFSEIRDKIFKEAVRRKYNIIYDTTFNPKKDIIGEYVVPHIVGTDYNAIKVIHIYSDVETIQRRLNTRHKAFLKQKTYMRAVPKSMVSFFIKDNSKGFDNTVRNYAEDGRFEFYSYDNGENVGELKNVTIENIVSNSNSSTRVTKTRKIQNTLSANTKNKGSMKERSLNLIEISSAKTKKTTKQLNSLVTKKKNNTIVEITPPEEGLRRSSRISAKIQTPKK